MRAFLPHLRSRAALWAGALWALAITIHQCLEPLQADGWLAVWAGGLVNDGGIPRGDRWTSMDVTGWVDQQWLGQWIIWGLNAALGTTGLIIVGLILPALLALALAALVARRRGAPEWAIGLALPIGALAIAPFLVVRPQTLVLPLFVLALGILIEGRQRPERLWFLLPILLVWANIHGSVLLMSLIALGGVAWAIAPLWSGAARRDRVLFGVLGGGILVAPLLSPLMMELPGYYLRMLAPDGAPGLAMEWAPLDAGSDRLLALLVIGAGALCAAGRRLIVPERILLPLLALGTLVTVRYGVWLALAVTLAAPVALGALQPPAGGPAAWRRILSRLRDGAAARAAAAVGALLVVATVAVAPMGQITADASPARVLLERPGAILADPHIANWLLIEYPALAGRIAFDSRLELYAAGDLTRGVNALAGADDDRSPVLGRYALIAIGPDDRATRLARLGPRVRILASGPDVTVAAVTR